MTISIRRRPLFVYAVAMVILLSVTLPPPLYALPERSEIDYFYSGCGTKTYLGDYGVDCYGHHPNAYHGGLPYKWRYHEEIMCSWGNCSEFCVTQTWWAEKCSNGTLKYITQAQFNAAVCTC